MADNTVYGKTEARRMLPELVARARDGETVLIGMRGLPEARLVSYLAPVLSDIDLATLARGLGEAQAYRMFKRYSRTSAQDADSVMKVVPDNLAADVVKFFTDFPGGRDFAAELVTSMVLTTQQLYTDAGLEPPSLDRVIVGLSISAGDHPALYDQLVKLVVPKIRTILHYICEAEQQPTG